MNRNEDLSDFFLHSAIRRDASARVAAVAVLHLHRHRATERTDLGRGGERARATEGVSEALRERMGRESGNHGGGGGGQYGWGWMLDTAPTFGDKNRG